MKKIESRLENTHVMLNQVWFAF